jgi:hypothetical protein
VDLLLDLDFMLILLYVLMQPILHLDALFLKQLDLLLEELYLLSLLVHLSTLFLHNEVQYLVVLLKLVIGPEVLDELLDLFDVVCTADEGVLLASGACGLVPRAALEVAVTCALGDHFVAGEATGAMIEARVATPVVLDTHSCVTVQGVSSRVRGTEEVPIEVSLVLEEVEELLKHGVVAPPEIP